MRKDYISCSTEPGRDEKIRDIIADVFRLERKDLLSEPPLPRNKLKRIIHKYRNHMCTVSYAGHTVQVSEEGLVLANRIYEHLKSKWKEGLGYNARYALLTAQEHGLLDEKFNPCEGGSPPMSRMSELFKLGGHEAVTAYNQTMGIK